jgi:hypothetical protein
MLGKQKSGDIFVGSGTGEIFRISDQGEGK